MYILNEDMFCVLLFTSLHQWGPVVSVTVWCWWLRMSVRAQWHHRINWIIKQLVSMQRKQFLVFVNYILWWLFSLFFLNYRHIYINIFYIFNHLFHFHLLYIPCMFNSVYLYWLISYLTLCMMCLRTYSPNSHTKKKITIFGFGFGEDPNKLLLQ